MRSIVVICVIAAFALAGPSVWAAYVPFTPDSADLDQYQVRGGISDVEEHLGTSDNVGWTTVMAQTFMAAGSPTGSFSGSPTGTLYGIQIGMPDYRFNNLSELVVGIYRGQPTAGSASPTWTSLTSFPVPVSELLSLPQDAGFYNNYCLSSPTLSVSVTAGTIYSIVLSAKDQIGTAYVGATHYGNYYGGGELWKTDQYGLWQKESSNPEWLVYDMQFRTFVEPEPVPLPAGVWLGICAVSVAGWHLKRQKA